MVAIKDPEQVLETQQRESEEAFRRDLERIVHQVEAAKQTLAQLDAAEQGQPQAEEGRLTPVQERRLRVTKILLNHLLEIMQLIEERCRTHATWSRQGSGAALYTYYPEQLLPQFHIPSTTAIKSALQLCDRGMHQGNYAETSEQIIRLLEENEQTTQVQMELIKKLDQLAGNKQRADLYISLPDITLEQLYFLVRLTNVNQAELERILPGKFLIGRDKGREWFKGKVKITGYHQGHIRTEATGTHDLWVTKVGPVLGHVLQGKDYQHIIHEQTVERQKIAYQYGLNAVKLNNAFAHHQKGGLPGLQAYVRDHLYTLHRACHEHWNEPETLRFLVKVYNHSVLQVHQWLHDNWSQKSNEWEAAFTGAIDGNPRQLVVEKIQAFGQQYQHGHGQQCLC
ncbi:hypothetical protein HYW21_09345 [Candidatus Woesearchaeota archaeon]|nr:hypothetical protein [Candidatus Woesearchaeota archaeon]